MAGPAVVNAILSSTQDAHVRAAMLMGSYLESGWNDASVGDQGTSYGPFQIHLPAHPGVTAAQAEDPSYAVAFMLPAYQAGASRVPAGLWNSNPSAAAATAAYYAERPSVMYPASRYTAAWPAVSAALSGGDLNALGGSVGGDNAKGAIMNSGSGAQLVDTSPTGTCLIGWSSFCVLTKTEARALLGGALLVAGGLVAVVGLVVLMKQASVPDAAKATAGALTPTDQTSPEVQKKLSAPAGVSGRRATSGASSPARRAGGTGTMPGELTKEYGPGGQPKPRGQTTKKVVRAAVVAPK